jgi:hypothetical protein
MTGSLSQAGGGTTAELSYAVCGLRAGGFRDIPTVADAGTTGFDERL